MYREIALSLFLLLVFASTGFAAAGDIKPVYSASSNLTVTNLNGVGSSATWTSGWTSALIDHSSTTVDDDQLVAKVTAESTGLSAGQINLYLLIMLDDTNWPDVYSTGTEGSEGAATIHDSNTLNGTFILAATILTDTTASQVYTLVVPSVKAACGGRMPHKYVVYIAQSTGTTIETTGNQVTYKSSYYNVE